MRITLPGCLLMTVDTVIKGMEEPNGADLRSQDADITQPLDYEVEELVKEIIESQQRPPSFPKSVLPKLFRS